MPLPPGPNEPPIIQLIRWIRNPFELLADCQSRIGDAFSLRLPGLRMRLVVVSDPDIVKDVFALGSDSAHAGEANVILKPFLGQHSLLTLDGAPHMRHRKMMMPAFHGERMHVYGRTMIELANEAIDSWPIGNAFSMHRPMQSVTLNIIVRTVFGLAEGPRLRELTDVLTRTLDVAAWPLLLLPVIQRDLGRFSPWGRYKRLAEQAGNMLRGEIRRGRALGTKGRTDVLAMLLDARDEGGNPLAEDEVLDELVTLLVAGHETTATALVWTLRWLLPNPSLIARLRDEIATAEGDPQKIAKLELLDATVKESLRLQPVIPLVARVLKEPQTLGRLALPAGTAVAPSIYLVHRRPSLYPDPDRFRPERFFGFKPAPWEYLPFGGGLRRCIGAAFALYEMKMVLAVLLPRIDARLAAGSVRPTRRSVTVTPADGLPIVVTARHPRHAPATAA